MQKPCQQVMASNGVRQSEKERRVLVSEQVHMIGHEHPAVNRHPE